MLHSKLAKSEALSSVPVSVTFHDLPQTPLEQADPHLSIHVYQLGEQMSMKQSELTNKVQ